MALQTSPETKPNIARHIQPQSSLIKNAIRYLPVLGLATLLAQTVVHAEDQPPVPPVTQDSYSGTDLESGVTGFYKPVDSSFGVEQTAAVAGISTTDAGETSADNPKTIAAEKLFSPAEQAALQMLEQSTLLNGTSAIRNGQEYGIFTRVLDKGPINAKVLLKEEPEIAKQTADFVAETGEAFNFTRLHVLIVPSAEFIPEAVRTSAGGVRGSQPLDRLGNGLILRGTIGTQKIGEDMIYYWAPPAGLPLATDAIFAANLNLVLSSDITGTAAGDGNFIKGIAAMNTPERIDKYPDVVRAGSFVVTA